MRRRTLPNIHVPKSTLRLRNVGLLTGQIIFGVFPESLGATYKDKASGSPGAFGIFSCNGNNIMTTSGGGMIVSNNVEALEKMRFWATQARDPPPIISTAKWAITTASATYWPVSDADNCGCWMNACRRIFDRYVAELSDIDGLVFMPEAAFGRSNRWLSVITLDAARCRATPYQLMERLESENIEARPVWKPLHLQPLLEGCSYYAHHESGSVSDRLFTTGLCLPSGTNMNQDDQQRVLECIRKTL